MLTILAVKNLSVNIVHSQESPAVLDLFVIYELSPGTAIHRDISKLAYRIREVT